MKQMTPIEELRHSASHILATAVLRLFPETKLDIGPPTNTGFYYDFDLDHNFTAQDLESIESEMKKVVKVAESNALRTFLTAGGAKKVDKKVV